MKRISHFRALAAIAVLLATARFTLAVPYASGVRDLDGAGSGVMWEFVLNEAADNVKILRDGGNALDLGALGVGRHTFDLSSFSTFDIQVEKSAAAAWTSITDPSNLFDDFTIPSGVIINNDPSDLAYFGMVYVSQAATAATASGRAQGDGVYALTSDMKGVDASTFAAVADPNDTTQAKGSAFFGVSGSTTSSPWRLSLDASGNVIVADWSDAAGGVKYLSKNLTSGGRILAGTDFNGTPLPDAAAGAPVSQQTGPEGGVFSQEMDAFGRLPLHGSIAAQVYSRGTVGVDLEMWVIDEDLDAEFATDINDTNSVWYHNVGAATEYDAEAPTLVIDSEAIPKASDLGINYIGTFGGPGVPAGMLYSEQFEKFYLSQGRSAGTEASVIVVSAALDGSEALSPTLDWSSRQFSIDNGFDADTTTLTINDIFRRVRELAITPDGKFLVMHRSSSDSARFGVGNGALLLVPLDENGIPDIEIEGGVITNVIDITTVGNNGAHSSGAQIEFDAAGNLYVANSSITTGNIGQLVQVFSPGGNWMASTKSDGTFTLTPLAAGLDGDHNGDGFVNAADYALWRDQQSDDITGYNDWRSNFGGSAGSGTGATVPEPSTGVSLLMGWAGLLLARRWFGATSQ